MNIPQFLQENSTVLLLLAAAAVFLFGNGTLSLPLILEWLKKLLPAPGPKPAPAPAPAVGGGVAPEADTLEAAVHNFVALRKHCSGNLEAQKHLSDLWRHLEPPPSSGPDIMPAAPEGGAR